MPRGWRGSGGMVFVGGRGGSAVTTSVLTCSPNDHTTVGAVGALFARVSRENGGTHPPWCTEGVAYALSTSSWVPHGGAAALAAGSSPATRATILASGVALPLLHLDDSTVGTRFICVFVAKMNNVGERELQEVLVDGL